jgi:hypothetical protein
MPLEHDEAGLEPFLGMSGMCIGASKTDVIVRSSREHVGEVAEAQLQGFRSMHAA